MRAIWALISILAALSACPAAFAASGELDSSFGGDGVVTTNVGKSSWANAVALQPNGRILVGGSAGRKGHSPEFYALLRYRKSGSRDRSFSRDGRSKIYAGVNPITYVGIESLVLQPNGRIVAGGNPGDGATAGTIVRYRKKGSLDRSFADEFPLLNSSGDVWLGSGARAIAIQPDGRIVAVGGTSFGKFCPCHFTVGRLLADGRIDSSFGGDGDVLTDFAPSPAPDPAAADYYSSASAVLVQPDGKIVAAGTAGAGPGVDGFGLARYLPGGSLDASFSGDGIETTLFDAPRAGASAAVLQPDGKIVVAGSAGANTGAFAVARYNPDGTLDPSFSGDGRLTTDLGDSARAADVVLQPDGKIVVIGSSENATSGQMNFALARYGPDGSLDPTFSGDGTVVAGFGNANYFANAAALQADGKIVVAGRALAGGGSARFVVARFR